MANQELGTYISEYIDFYAQDDVKERGKKLYRDGRVTLQLYQKVLDTWIFSVKGSKMYKVHIRNVNKRQIDTTCSCPYTWGSVCKHTVAALLYLADVDADAETGMIRRRAESNLMPAVERPEWGMEIPGFEDITEGMIEDLTSFSSFRDIKYSYQSGHIEKMELLDQRITFTLCTPYVDDAQVTFRFENGKLFVSSSEKVVSTKLNNIEAYCLLKIAQSDTPNLFDLVFNERYKEQWPELFERYGLDADAHFDHYFRFGFDEKKGLVALPTEFSKGILPVDDNEVLIQGILKTINKDALFLEAIDKMDKEERELGFILSLNDTLDDDSEKECFFKLLPFIGKLNKDRTALASHFEDYFPNIKRYKINQSSRASELIDLHIDYSAHDDDAERYHRQKRVMELLAEEKHVYLRSGQSGEKIRKSELTPMVISAHDVDVMYQVEEDETFIALQLRLTIDGKEVEQDRIDPELSGEFIYCIDGVFHIATDFRAATLINQYAAPLKMVKSQKEHFLNQVIRPLANQVEIQFREGIYNMETVELDFQKKQVFLSEKNQHLVITPKVQYHHGQSIQLNTHGNVLVEEDDQLIYYKRNFELEDDFNEFIAALHPSFDAMKSNKLFHLHHQDFSRDMWFYKFFDILQMNNIEVYGLNDLKTFRYSPHKGHVTTSVSSGEDWFEVNVHVTFGDNTVKLSDIRKAVLNNQRYIQLKDGSVGILPTEWFHKFEKYFRHGEIKDDKLAVSKLHFSIIDDLFENIDDTAIIEELNAKRQKLATFTQIEETQVPAEITAELRPYQKEGLNWLHFLHEMNWGGILADDMGLGKTLQVLTFIQFLIKENRTTNLVVVPTTLLFNWENEINKFAPGLKAHYHYGPTRVTDTTSFDAFDLVFTTYGTLLRDIEMLREFQFNYVILDESQAIKNPASRRFKAASLLRANNRLALSGTPIENSTFDLYAQMSFVNRGFLGGLRGFKDNFSNAIDKEGDESRASELQRLIHPFVLRRTKEKVASELPPKTEDVIICEMEPAQRKVYDAYRNRYRDRLLGQIEQEGVGKTKMMVLEALTRLRQICDSPVLLKDDQISVTDSVKIREIIQHITDKTANHKILIFSQFVQMLKLVKDELISRSIPFEYLDGKSTSVQRERSVNNFQEDEELRVFLISLKAGGTGLNLTAADYVYILDPWWNPAVENQAIDRCYRIGQDKKVFAYRMICKDTVEEKILKLQARKKKIAGDIVQTDENIMKTLDVTDIQELFS